MTKNFYWDKNGNIISDTTEQVPLSFIEKQQRKLHALGDNASWWLNNSNPESEAYKQKASLTLSLITAPIGSTATLTSGIAKPLMPLLGKKIGQNIAQGIGSGLTGGAVEGFGRGLIEHENPLKTIAQDSAIGGVFGGLGGYGLSRIAKNLEKQRILNSSDNSVVLNNWFSNYVDGLNNKTKSLAEYRGLKQGFDGGNSGNLFDKLIRRLKYRDEWVRIGDKDYRVLNLPEKDYGKILHILDTNIKFDDSIGETITKADDMYEYTFLKVSPSDYKFIKRKKLK